MVDRRCHQIQGIGRLFLNGGMMCMTLETNMLGCAKFYFHMDIHGPSLDLCVLILMEQTLNIIIAR